MIRRPLPVALAFVLSALVLFAAVARITAMTLDLERAESAARQRATHEENVRIALWRLDATLAELIALENTRPAMRFCLAAEPAGLLALGEPTVAANAPGRTTPAGLARLVRARFELGAKGKLQLTPPAAAPVWIAALPIPEQPPPAPRRATRMAQAEPPHVDSRDGILNTPPVLLDSLNGSLNAIGQQSAFTQETLNFQAFARRQELGQQSRLVRPASAPGTDAESAFEARWLGGDLVLLRRVRRGDERLLQGTWLDWQALRGLLLGRVEPVVPASGLEPIHEAGDADPGRRLALLPARLVPGPMPETEPRDWTPLRLGIATAWGTALLGLAGIGSLLVAAMALSQRRADFVSAVTHELRTPLTTVRLYSGMLHDDTVPAEDRQSFLATLEREADRLGQLVDNVLAFSRLERRSTVRLESLALEDLLAPLLPSLEERAARGGLTLEVALAAAADTMVRADRASVEQILLNLVDNACKYAPGPGQPALQLAAGRRGRRVVLALRDHGPGIAAAERRRIFRPFHRSAARTAGSAPGVGLGLALARRLARQMGGDLRLVDSADGACFELDLPCR